jgi:hypothetical protein
MSTQIRKKLHCEGKGEEIVALLELQVRYWLYGEGCKVKGTRLLNHLNFIAWLVALP